MSLLRWFKLLSGALACKENTELHRVSKTLNDSQNKTTLNPHSRYHHSVSDRYSSLITFLNGLYSLERLKDIITLRFTYVIRSVHFSISILQNAITPVFKKGKQLREILKTIGWGFHLHIHFKLTRTLFLQTITTLTSLVSKPKQLNCRTVHLHGVI